MIEVGIRTRGYECDGTRTVSLPVVFSYLESLRWEWIQRPELGLVPHLHQGCFFVVQEQTAEIVRRFGMSTDVVVRGTFERVGRSQAIVRHAVLRVDDGALLAHARVTGCWLGANRRLARIPDETRAVGRADADYTLIPEAAWHVPERAGSGEQSFIDPADRCYEPLGLELALPETAAPDSLPADAASAQVVVRHSDLDIFDHVNASNWLRFIDDARRLGAASGALPSQAAGIPRRAAIHHPREACVGDLLTVRTWSAGANDYAAMVFRDDELVCRATVTVADA